VRRQIAGVVQQARRRTAPRWGPVRRILDVRGFGTRISVAHEDVAFRTRDGVRLVASYLPGPALPGSSPSAVAAALPAVAVAHGFAGHRAKPAYAYLAERLSRQAAVLAVDLRGHGASGGVCTLGDREALDLRAAAAWLRRRGHRWIAVVGASMGGIAALRAAGQGAPGTFDAICVISTPAVWRLAETPAMQALNRLVNDRWYRAAVSRLLGVRIAAAWGEPASPLEVVAAIAPTPLLVVHGIDDHFFSPEQSALLAAAAGPPCTRWLEPAGFGHAEDGFTPDFVGRLGEALCRVAATGDWGADLPAVGEPAPRGW
jgi:predicted alpha/beta-fold hydrolase